MTLVEVLISLALLSVLMVAILFGTSYLIGYVQNRLIAMPNYVGSMMRLYNNTFSKASDLAYSATFAVEGNKVHLYTESGSATTIDFSRVTNGTSGTLTLSSTKAIDIPALMAHLSVTASDGRVFDNSVVVKKLIDAAPVINPKGILLGPTSATISLRYPAIGFYGLTSSSTCTTIDAFYGLSWATTPLTATKGRICLQNPISVLKNEPSQSYMQLSFSFTGSYGLLSSASTVYIGIPGLVGVDSTTTATIWLKVKP